MKFWQLGAYLCMGIAFFHFVLYFLKFEAEPTTAVAFTALGLGCELEAKWEKAKL